MSLHRRAASQRHSRLTPATLSPLPRRTRTRTPHPIVALTLPTITARLAQPRHPGEETVNYDWEAGSHATPQTMCSLMGSARVLLRPVQDDLCTTTDGAPWAPTHHSLTPRTPMRPRRPSGEPLGGGKKYYYDIGVWLGLRRRKAGGTRHAYSPTPPACFRCDPTCICHRSSPPMNM